MTVSNQALRKAAILIDSLDSRSADELLEQMGEQLAGQVRQAVMQLGDVAQGERDRIIAEFMASKGQAAGDTDSPGGVELDLSFAAKMGADANGSPSAIAANAPAHKTARPFAWLEEASTASLAALLASEHPQVAAVVIAHLAPPQAADVLAALPANLQTETVRRIVELDETSPEILHEVEQQIASLLSHQSHLHRRQSAGLAAMGAILASARGSNRSQILENLAGRDRSLADRVDQAADAVSVGSPVSRWRRQLTETNTNSSDGKQPSRPEKNSLTIEPTPQEEYGLPADHHTEVSQDADTERPIAEVELAFEDLLQLDDRALAAVLAAAQSDMALLALTGAPKRLVDRVMKQLSRRQARSLTKRMQQSGPLRLRDIETAQQQLARIAGRLVARGEIKAPSSRRFAVAA